MAYLHLTVEDSLFDGYEKLLKKRGKSVEQGLREFLATLLLPTDEQREEAQYRLINSLPLSHETLETVQQTYPKEDC